MRKLLMIAAMAMLSVTAFAKDIHKLVVKSERMHCGKCANKVINGLEKVDGVKSVGTDLSTHEITVFYDNDKVTEETLVKELASIGYSATVVSNEKSKKVQKFKDRPSAEGCSGGGKCEDEKADKKDKKQEVDGVTGATKKK